MPRSMSSRHPRRYRMLVVGEFEAQGYEGPFRYKTERERTVVAHSESAAKLIARKNYEDEHKNNLAFKRVVEVEAAPGALDAGAEIREMEKEDTSFNRVRR